MTMYTVFKVLCVGGAVVIMIASVVGIVESDPHPHTHNPVISLGQHVEGPAVIASGSLSIGFGTSFSDGTTTWRC
jgi:hypothetical protein